MDPQAIQRLRKLVLAPGPAQLGPTPRPGTMTPEALAAELNSIFQDGPPSAASRDLVRALLLLWHDHLDASHTIAQGIENRDGSLVHAIMHRREPDYWNSKYWWRRVGKHPCFAELAGQVGELLRLRQGSGLAARLVTHGRWDAFVFVDECQSVARAPALEPERCLQAIQQIETQVVLQHFIGAEFPLGFALP